MKCVVEVQVQTSDPNIFYLKISAKKNPLFYFPPFSVSSCSVVFLQHRRLTPQREAFIMISPS